MTLSICLVEHQEAFTSDRLASLYPAGVVACDFYVEGAESAEPVTGGYRFGRRAGLRTAHGEVRWRILPGPST